MKKLFFFATILTMLSASLFFACQKEEKLITNDIASLNDEAAVSDSRGDECGCQIKINSVTDESGMNKPVRLWEFTLGTFPSPGLGSFNWTDPLCGVNPTTAQMGVWYNLHPKLCQRECSIVSFSAFSGECLESWRVRGNFTIKSGLYSETFEVIANEPNNGKFLTDSTFYSIGTRKGYIGCVPLGCSVE